MMSGSDCLVISMSVFCLAACSAQKAAPHQAAPPAPAPTASAPAPAPTPPPSSSAAEPSQPNTFWFTASGGDECAMDGSAPCQERLSCFPRDPAEGGRGVCALATTIPELLSDYRYSNRLVGLRNTVPMHLTACTDMGCLGPNQCCNSCSSKAYVQGDAQYMIMLAQKNGELYTARGNECDIRNRYPIRSVPHVIVGSYSSSTGKLRVEYMTPEAAGP